MKKIIALVCTLAIILSLGMAAFAAKDSRGDLNADGDVTLADAMLAFGYVAKATSLTEMKDPLAMDVNQDYNVTMADALLIFNKLATGAEFPEFNADFDYDKLAENLGVVA